MTPMIISSEFKKKFNVEILNTLILETLTVRRQYLQKKDSPTS